MLKFGNDIGSGTGNCGRYRKHQREKKCAKKSVKCGEFYKKREEGRETERERKMATLFCDESIIEV